MIVMEKNNSNQQKVISRWEKVFQKEIKIIPTTSEALILKSALCGFLAGDGSVQVRKEKTFFHYQLDFFPDDKLMLETYLKIIAQLYQKTPSVRIRDNVFQVRLTSKTTILDLLQYTTFGLHTWDIPYSLFTIPNAKEYWLKAFFSAEAYVGKNAIKIQTVNSQGMVKVSKLLTELNIAHNCYQYEPKIKYNSLVSIIVIGQKKARQDYLEKVGFWHLKKENVLKKSLDL